MLKKILLEGATFFGLLALALGGIYFWHDYQLAQKEKLAFAEPEEPQTAVVLEEESEEEAAPTTEPNTIQRVTFNIHAPLNAVLKGAAVGEARAEMPVKQEPEQKVVAAAPVQPVGQLPAVVVSPTVHKPSATKQAAVTPATPAQKPSSGPMDNERWRTLSKSQKYAFVASYLRRMNWTCPPSGHDRAWEMDQLDSHDWSTIRNFGFNNCTANTAQTAAARHR